MADSMYAKLSQHHIRDLNDDSNRGPTIVQSSWKPLWLRSRILAIFSIGFFAVAAVIGTIFWLSEKKNGLINSNTEWQYLWRFLPTAVLVAFGALWSRVELQSMRYAPFMAFFGKGTMDPALLSLDYLDMLSPIALGNSLKNRHYVVSISLAVSLLFKAMIVLSTSLLQHRLVNHAIEVSIDIRDSFRAPQSTISIASADTRPYYATIVEDIIDVELPFGVTTSGVYQTFTANASESVAPIRAIVDGLHVELECLQLESASQSVRAGGAQLMAGTNGKADATSGVLDTPLSLKFRDCDAPIDVFTYWGLCSGSPCVRPEYEDPHWWLFLKQNGSEGLCPSLPQSQPQFINIAAKYQQSERDESTLEISNIGAVICAVDTVLSQVEVTLDGNVPSVRPIENSPRASMNVDFDNLLSYSIPRLAGGSWNGSFDGRPISIQGQTSLGPLKVEAMEYSGATALNDTLVDSGAIEAAMRSLYSRLAPLVAHYHLRSEGITTGTATTEEPVLRLVVSEPIALAMASISALMAILIIVLLFVSRRMIPKFRRDPATLLGQAIFLDEHRNILPNFDAQAWVDCNQSPAPLRIWNRLPFTLIIIGLGAALIYTLDLSQGQNGIVDVSDGPSRLGWTVLPGLIFVLVSLNIGSANTVIRKFAVHSYLSLRSGAPRLADTSQLDSFGPMVVARAVRTRQYHVAIMEVLTVLSALLTVFAGILFTVETVPESTSYEVARSSHFEDVEISQGERHESLTALAKLLLRQKDSQKSYPENTYDTLAFPLWDSSDIVVSSNMSAVARTTALQLHSECRALDLTTTNTTCQASNMVTDGWMCSLSHEILCEDGTVSSYNAGGPQSGSPDPMFWEQGRLVVQPGETGQFAKALGGVLQGPGVCNTLNASTDTWRTETYGWGTFGFDEAQVNWTTVITCNYTWTDVDVDVSLLSSSDGSLVLDVDNPPRLDEDSRRPHTSGFAVQNITMGGEDRSYPNLTIFPLLNETSSLFEIDRQFQIMMQPYGTLLVEDLKRQDSIEKILDNLRHNYAFLAAQIASRDSRVQSAAQAETPKDRFTISNGTRQRLLQNEIPTYVLVGILGTIALFQLGFLVMTGLHRLGWMKERLVDMDLKGLGPAAACSMAAGFGLLQESNIAELATTTDFSYKAPNPLDDGEVRMGWFWSKALKRKVFTVGVLGGNDLVFLEGKTLVNVNQR